MPQKIRVFVSSTMEDLANERAAVVEAIRRLNFEPVNAEGILPNGATSWDVLEPEICSSLICILIQGDRYGWVPTQGYGAGQGKSVTHLEIDIARKQGIPVLPFLKKLKYGAESTSKDAVLRDRFRREIGDWREGHFRGEFDLASDLGDKVSRALLGVLTSTYLKTAVQTRIARRPALRPEVVPVSPDVVAGALASHTGPDELLFAGAGMSLSAGFPSSVAMAGVLGQALGIDLSANSRHSLAQLFEVAEASLGRTRILGIVGELLDPPQPVEPTAAHLAAVRRFPLILTTNYDRLFERACELLNIRYVVRTPEDGIANDKTAPVTIFKIDGSIDRPETLVLTPADAKRARSAQQFWQAVEAALQVARPIVIGHSMRDANSLALMEGRNRDLRGVFVAPVIDPIDARLVLERLNLEGVQSSAAEYLWSGTGSQHVDGSD